MMLSVALSHLDFVEWGVTALGDIAEARKAAAMSVGRRVWNYEC